MSPENMEERVGAVRTRLAAACERCGRDPASVRLVAVSKTYGPDAITEAVRCGVDVFGENRVQEAAAKIEYCPPGLEWHLIGHLQSNKARVAVRMFDLIHSVDSPKLLQAVDRLSREEGVTQRLLLQVNVSGEASKFGLSPDEVPALLEASRDCMNVEVAGLMTMPPLTTDPQKAAPYFARLRSLRDVWRDTSGLDLDELSMGMSHDCEVAIAEGATLVRIGTALFGERGGRKAWQAE
jgi:pyridoxal phosphate enzyme (YggS family)